MTHTLFSGCSYTAGSGFDLKKQEPDLWCNQLHQTLFPDTIKINVSQGGRSNAGVFQDTVQALVSYPVKFAFVQWTSMPRYELEVGFELYTTRQDFGPNAECWDHNLNQINYSSSYLNSVRDRFTSLAHEQYEIVNLVRYTNTISKLAKLTNTKVWFINGLCHWDQDFFVRQHNVLPNQYTRHTQTLLNTNNRDDEEIEKLYTKMHDQYQDAGGIDPTQWLNLYQSMRQCRVDVNSDKVHPGVQSNSQYAGMFCQQVTHDLELLAKFY